MEDGWDAALSALHARVQDRIGHSTKLVARVRARPRGETAARARFVRAEQQLNAVVLRLPQRPGQAWDDAADEGAILHAVLDAASRV